MRNSSKLVLLLTISTTLMSCGSNIQLETPLFYNESGKNLADVIPYYENGTYYLYYLSDPKDGYGINWNLVTTKDFINYEEHGVVIERGLISEQDFCAFTGSVIKKDGKYHIFYTGANGAMPNDQAIMHAIGDTPYSFNKVAEDTLYANTKHFEVNDFRDPYVYYDDTLGKYLMLITARHKNTSIDSNKRGVIARYISSDLTNWEVYDTLYAPNKYFALECPDLFKMGDYYYLIFSEFTTEIRTKYVMSKDLKEWIEPIEQEFDARGFYAAKSVSDGNKRYLCGWNPVKDNDNDAGGWLWGGSLVVHELIQNDDFTLTAKMSNTFSTLMNKPVFSKDKTELSSVGISMEEIYSPNSKQFAVEAYLSGDYKKGGLTISKDNTPYKYSFDFNNKTFSFDNTPNVNKFTDLYRKTKNIDETIKLQIIVDNQVAVAYLNEKYALTTRVYEDYQPNISLFLDQGNITCSFINVYEF